MLKVYLDHYLTKLGFDSRVRAWFRSFRFRVFAVSAGLMLVIISVSLFAVYHDHSFTHRNVVNVDANDMKDIKNQLDLEKHNGVSSSHSNNSHTKHLSSGNNKPNIDDDDDNHDDDDDGPIDGKTILRSNSDVQSTLHEIRSATWVISDELREHYPFHRCVKFIQSNVEGTELNESKDILNYCKVIVIDYILESSMKSATKSPSKKISPFSLEEPKTKPTGRPIEVSDETIKPKIEDRVDYPTEGARRQPDRRLLSEYCLRICQRNPALGGQICHCDSPPLMNQ